MPQTQLVVHVSGRLRHRWLLNLALWLIRRVRVDVYADGRRIGSDSLDTRIEEETEI